MSDKLVNVTFLSTGRTVEVSKGTTLLKSAQAAGLQIEALCGGRGTCGKCRGKIIHGAASEPGRREKELLSKEEIDNGVALLCQRPAEGDVTAELESLWTLEEEFFPGKGDHSVKPVQVDPVVTKRLHCLSPPSVSDQTSDLERILNDLPAQTTIDNNLLPLIPSLARKAGYQMTSAVFDNVLISIEARNTVSEHFGIAVDIGTTSVAGYLVDLNRGKVISSCSAANRQRVHGADVIARIDYTVEHPEGLSEMQQLVVKTIDEIVTKLLAATGISSNRIYAVTIVGNTVMSHLLLGVSPRGIATSPFVPAFSREVKGNVKYLGIKSLPSRTRFILLPNIAGYVGSDTVGLILATKIYNLPGNWLAVDIGTNGEVVLSNKGRLFTCSTAAGPAFEGATISQGMRAEPGAVYKVSIQNDIDVSVIGDQKAKGICGSGLVDVVSQLKQLGVIKNNGRFNIPTECPQELPSNIKQRIINAGRVYKFALAKGPPEVVITQKDISELQLGKAAIRAGIEILMEVAGIQKVDGILLAGAFGNNLRPESLLGLGMLPKVNVNQIKPVGNAAGVGAIMSLLSKSELETAMELSHRVEHIELSLYKDFQKKLLVRYAFKDGV